MHPGRQQIVRKLFPLFFIPILILIALCSCREPVFDSDPVSPVDNPMFRNVPDVDVPMYTLHLEDGKVVANVDYVVNIDMGDRDEFRILNFADIQLDGQDVEERNSEYAFMFRTTENLVAAARPDLITLTGDQTSDGDPAGITVIGNQMDSFGVPWAPVYGNHDDAYNRKGVPIEEQSVIYRSFENCIYRDGPAGLNRILENGSDALGNYVVNIVKVSGDEFRIVRTLIFMNSGSREDYSTSGYTGQRPYGDGTPTACLNRNQIEWYKQMVASAQSYGDGKAVPSGIFLHIPTFGYVYAASAAFNLPIDFYNYKTWVACMNLHPYYRSFGTTMWNTGYKDSYGVMHEVLCCPPYEEGMFRAMKEAGSDFILAGHDHMNNFNIKYDGIRFVYGLKTGRGSYNELLTVGGTLITVSSDGSVSFRNILDFSDVMPIGPIQ